MALAAQTTQTTIRTFLQTDTLTGEPVLPEFSYPLAEMFD